MITLSVPPHENEPAVANVGHITTTRGPLPPQEKPLQQMMPLH